MKQIFSSNRGGKILIISLTINVMGLVMAGGLGWHYREKFADKLGLMAQKPSDESLLAFNNERFEVLNDSLIIDGRDTTVTILFLGNSLTYCGVADEDPDKTKRGLSSTSIEKDYVHRLVSMISKRDSVNVRYSVTNIADFEREFYLRPFPWEDKLVDAKVQQPHILIVQMGENVSTEAITNHREEFICEYVNLLERYPNSQRIITLPFWMDVQKCDAITEVALCTRSRLADLSHLGHRNSDCRNFAKYYRQYSNPGVGEHPSDYGFEQITKNLLIEIDKK